MSTLIDTHALETALQTFADERDWQRFHTPRSLILALTGELGELAEIFQWLPDDEAAQIMQSDKAAHVREEVADVLLYLMRLAMVLDIDIDAAVRDKMARNAIKYPPQRAL